MGAPLPWPPKSRESAGAGSRACGRTCRSCTRSARRTDGLRGEKWGPLAKPPICGVAHPYTDLRQEPVLAARDLRARGAEVLLMDCMGYTENHRATAREASGLPVILSNALVAKLASEAL